MPYIIAEPCIDTKDKSCVNVCPVDCIFGDDEDRMLYINPDECIDCGACEPECPVSAIFPPEELPAKWAVFTDLNKDYFEGKRGEGKANVRKRVLQLYPNPKPRQ
jgi:NAD-dependent dihydropyrimidine dehydrogenase PreA subunit